MDSAADDSGCRQLAHRLRVGSGCDSDRIALQEGLEETRHVAGEGRVRATRRTQHRERLGDGVGHESTGLPHLRQRSLGLREEGVRGVEARDQHGRIRRDHRRERSRSSRTSSGPSPGISESGPAVNSPCSVRTSRAPRFGRVTRISPSCSSTSTCSPPRSPSRSRIAFGITSRPARSMVVIAGRGPSGRRGRPVRAGGLEGQRGDAALVALHRALWGAVRSLRSAPLGDGELTPSLSRRRARPRACAAAPPR